MMYLNMSLTSCALYKGFRIIEKFFILMGNTFKVSWRWKYFYLLENNFTTAEGKTIFTAVGFSMKYNS